MEKQKTFNQFLLFVSLIGIAFFCFNLFVLRSDLKALYDYKRLFVIVTITICVCVLLFSSKYRACVINQFLNLPTSILYLLTGVLVSAIIANLTGYYFLRAQTDFFYFLGLALLTANLAMVTKKLRLISYAFFTLFVVLGFASVVIGHWATIYYLKMAPTIHSLISFTNPRMLNQLLIWTLIPTLYLAIVTTKHKSRRWLAMIPPSLNFSIMFALDARGFAVSGFGAVILWILIDKPIRFKIVSITLISLLLGYAIKTIFLSPLPQYLYLGVLTDDLFAIRTNGADRIAVWLEAIRMLSFWGHGGDTYVCNATITGRPHNSLLLVAINWGMIAAVCYIGLMFNSFIFVLKSRQRKIIVTGVTLLSGFAYSLVSGVLDSPLSQLIAVISIALFWRTIYSSSAKIVFDLPLSGFTQLISHTALIFCSFLFIGLVGYKVYLRIDNNFYREISPPKYIPQFWLGQNCINSLPKLDVQAK